MKQQLLLLKAIMTEDMDLFKIKAKNSSNKKQKILLPLFLAILFMYGIGTYLYMIAKELSKVNLTYIVLTISMLIPTMFILIEGIYKSQSILFETKDNDLLLSLPIKKSKIIIARLVKFLSFQYFYNLLFILPGIVLYAYFEKPSLNFYIITFIMSFLSHIIPTIISSFVGFIIKKISVKFNSKKIIQTILTMAIFLIIFYISFNTNQLITKIVNNATNINDIILKIYYPLGLYIKLINKFNLIQFLKLISITVLPLVIFVIIISKFYFGIVSKNKTISIKNNKNKTVKFNQNNKYKTLIKKEIKRYFSSTVYMFNTLIGPTLMLIITIAMSINLNSLIKFLSEGKNIGISLDQIIQLMPKIFFGLIIMTSCMTSITSSSISLEGKSFNLTKSLPIEAKDILKSKILFSNLICIPLILICDIIFIITFNISIIDIIFIIFISLIAPILIAIIGLFINLKYPKMDATSDAEVVKQSASSMISVFLGMIIGVVLIMALVFGRNKINIVISLEISTLLIANIILWNILKRYGTKRIKEINI